jgi:hypothetical protein
VVDAGKWRGEPTASTALVHPLRHSKYSAESGTVFTQHYSLYVYKCDTLKIIKYNFLTCNMYTSSCVISYF